MKGESNNKDWWKYTSSDNLFKKIGEFLVKASVFSDLETWALWWRLPVQSTYKHALKVIL
jgi:hypothetical protein